MGDELNEAGGPQQFEYDEVKSLIDQSIEPILGSNIYNPKKVHDWTSAVVEGTVHTLCYFHIVGKLYSCACLRPPLP